MPEVFTFDSRATSALYSSLSVQIRSSDVGLSSWPRDEDAEDTSWFFTPEWQEGEAKVDEHIRAGRVQQYESVSDFIAHLHRRKAKRGRGRGARRKD